MSTFRALGFEATGIDRVAVIGAGSMGSGIAAQFANAGLPVDLLDILGGEDGNAPAEAGIARQAKSRGFMGEAAAGRICPGNTEDDLGRLAAADWIIEVVVEDLEVKRALFRRIEAVRKPGSIVSSNTSTLRRADLVRDMERDFACDFVITHFFNPPRMMPLVELVAGPENDARLVARAAEAAEVLLGKTVIACRDTPGFIANRIGCTWMAMAALEARRLSLTIEEADAVHAAFGAPRTGVFALFDLIGLDLVPRVWQSLMDALPEGDAIRRFDLPGDPLFRNLIEEGRFGRKAGAGFYRKADDGTRQALDLETGAYRPERAVEPGALPGGGRDLAAMLDDGGRLGAYAWRVFALLLRYAAEHGPEIADDAGAVDAAFALGYGWKAGPFALADRLGAQHLAERIAAEGEPVPALLCRAAKEGGFYDAAGAPLAMEDGRGKAAATPRLSVAALRSRLAGNDAASLWDMGDGVACFAMTTKMSSFSAAVFDALEEALDRLGGAHRALVLGNDDPRAFSVGADLGYLLSLIDAGDFAAIEAYLKRGQRLFRRMRAAPFPVVAAAHGFALGGGAEFALHADAIVAHAELAMGLPEPSVGLVPGWGGCTQLLLRCQEVEPDPGQAVARAFAAVLAARPSGSAAEAMEAGFLRPTDGIVMAHARLLEAARARALAAAAEGYAPPEPARLRRLEAGGRDALLANLRAALEAGQASVADLEVAVALAGVFVAERGADPVVSEAEMMAAERDAVLRLSRTPSTRARMEHMLRTGKPLRN